MKLVTPKAAEATKLIVTYFMVGIVSCATLLWLQHRQPPPALISCADLQRELNRRHPELNLKVDGRCGPATQAAWDAECNTQYALADWPEDAR